MKEELIGTVKEFIAICDELHNNGKINDQLYDELTKNKIAFLNNVENHAT
ncbi:hypothetical protein [Wukongibacter sp. M2B1]